MARGVGCCGLGSCQRVPLDVRWLLKVAGWSGSALN